MNIFRKHDLTADQELHGSILSTEQIAVLENLMSSIGQEIVETTLKEDDSDRFRKIAHAQGQLKILQHIVAVSNTLTNTGDI